MDAALLLAGALSRFHGVQHGLPGLLRSKINELIGQGQDEEQAGKPQAAPSADPGGGLVGGTGATPGGGG